MAHDDKKGELSPLEMKPTSKFKRGSSLEERLRGGGGQAGKRRELLKRGRTTKGRIGELLRTRGGRRAA